MARAAISHSHYVSALGALRLLLSDAWAALHQDSGEDGRSTLTPRSDLDGTVRHGVLGCRLKRDTRASFPEPEAATAATPSAFGMLQALEDDVATYVTRNDVRERVRGFIEDALCD